MIRINHPMSRGSSQADARKQDAGNSNSQGGTS